MGSHSLARISSQIALLALGLFALELAFVLSSAWSAFASTWEMRWGVVWLTPSALCAFGAASAVCWPVAGWLLEGTPRARVASAVAFAVFGAWVGFGVSDGRHFELWWRRAGFVAVLAGAGATSAWFAAPWLHHWAARRARTLALYAVAAAVLCEVVNQRVLVRLYPAFHWGLALLTVGAAVFAWRLWPRDSHASSAPAEARASRTQLGVAIAAWVVCIAALLPSSRALAGFDNFRWVVRDRAPLASHAVHLAAWLSPPPPIETLEQGEARDTAPSERGLDLRGRDVLFVTIDALRADHVGSYGYSRNTTPHIDRLAAEGARVEWAYSATPHTSYSITSLMTGKYIRPLLLQGVGRDSDTWASVLRTYGYRTAAFYPPAVFFIDGPSFRSFEESSLGFEYEKKEFLEGEPRVRQVVDYLDTLQDDQRTFVWVHLFAPHEPYERHPEWDFGERDVDRYDSEIASADAVVGRLTEEFRRRHPDGVVIVTSDHGEEFGEHGGRYHGTTVYEEQVRVPLVISAPGAIAPRVLRGPAQTIDLMPTVLAGLGVPLRPRLRGRDLGSVLAGLVEEDDGFAHAEIDQQALLATGPWRLVCERQLGACRLYDVASDPRQTRDLSARHPERFEQLRRQLRQLNASHGQFERQGLRAEGQGWPSAIVRGLAGDGEAAAEIAELLDDADVVIRRRAAETLFALRRPETRAALELSLGREEDEVTRRYCALALTRLGSAASLTQELLKDPDPQWRRHAALVLAETGDGRGRHELLAWWARPERSHGESLDLLAAFARIRAKEAVGPLLGSLGDVRLRPQIAATLAAIGEDAARGRLAQALAVEPYQTGRVALTRALLELGADNELVIPLRRWLGVPDPLVDGLALASQAGILEHLGGPSTTDLSRLRDQAEIGALVRLVVPKGGNGKGVRLLVRARNTSAEPGSLWLGSPQGVFTYDSKGKLTKSRKVPEIHPKRRVELRFGPGPELVEEAFLTLPSELGIEPGRAVFAVVLASRGLQPLALAVLPLQDELRAEARTSDEPKASESPRQAGNTSPDE